MMKLYHVSSVAQIGTENQPREAAELQTSGGSRKAWARSDLAIDDAQNLLRFVLDGIDERRAVLSADLTHFTLDQAQVFLHSRRHIAARAAVDRTSNSTAFVQSGFAVGLHEAESLQVLSI